MVKKQTQKNTWIHIVFSIVGLVVAFMVFFVVNQASAVGDLHYKASGFAYGAMDDDEDEDIGVVGVGYVSFGCQGDVGNACLNTTNGDFPSGYGVYLNADPDSTGYRFFSGYAWSSNYGWISFNRPDVQNICGTPVRFPTDDVASFVANNEGPTVISGWAKVLNPGPQGDGYWDGCIRFGSVENAGSQNATTIEAESGVLKLGGWAWGSNLTGWISFDCPDCSVKFDAVDEILGCTNSGALNYDPNATSNDGSCEFEGCMDPLANNFNPNAVEDNGSCTYGDDNDGDDNGGGGDTGDDNSDTGDTQSSDLALYIGSVNSSNVAIIGNTSYLLNVTDVTPPQTVKLVPMAFNNPVQSCVASVVANTQGSQANFSNWSGPLPIDILNPGVASFNFESTITNYDANEIYEYTITCISTVNNQQLSASAFVTTQHPPASVSITANPSVIDTTSDLLGQSTVSWTFSNVVQNSCEIEGYTEIDGGTVIPMNSAMYQIHNFTSTNPSAPGSDQIVNVLNLPVAFVLTCDAFNGSTAQDSTYITTTELGCTQAMEDAGFCTNRVNPIFEEF
jgi:hypothetical protein